MIVTAWRGNSAYGFKVSQQDRDQCFSRDWKCIYLLLPGENEAFAVNIDKPSFWNDTCRELIHKRIKEWLTVHGYIPWQKGHPPKFEMRCMEDNYFTIHTIQG